MPHHRSIRVHRRGTGPRAPRRRSVLRETAGFALLEMLVASAILATGLVALAYLAVVATSAVGQGRRLTLATMLAVQKMEQLRALAWGYDLLGLPLSDTASDVAQVPTAPAGGPGLQPSPPGSLAADMPGYVDVADSQGRWVGADSLVPVAGGFVRRWSVEALAANPADTRVLRVAVFATTGQRTASVPDVVLASVKTRKRW
jgi:prepilin-type N-terminal cleavage/methylation domain-containing protein